MQMIKNLQQTEFVGTNPQVALDILKQIEPTITTRMTNEEIKVYQWTVETVINLLEQFLKNTQDENSNLLLFYDPSVAIETEYTHANLINLINERIYNDENGYNNGN